MSFASFVHAGKPLTSNKNVGKIGQRVQAEYRALYGQRDGEPDEIQRYGIVHYFVRDYRPAIHADAGNISKRVWDALEGLAYKDDHVVRVQISSVIHFGPTNKDGISYADVDLSSVPESSLVEILQNIAGTAEHFIYVELGPLKSNMFVFGLGEDAIE